MGLFDFLQPKHKRRHTMTEKAEAHNRRKSKEAHHIKQDAQVRLLKVQEDLRRSSDELGNIINEIAVATGGKSRGLK